jgi:hypothetical protein
MSPLRTVRARMPRHVRRSALHLECLESRLPLAGNVTAQLLGSTLVLTGDALDNQVIVASAPDGKMAVFGPAGNTINGSTNAFTTSRAVTNIVANLNGGSDQIGFGNDATALRGWLQLGGTFWPQSIPDLQSAINTATGSTPAFVLPGSLSVTTGAGNDAVGIVGNVGGSVAANLGSAIAGATSGNGFGIGDSQNKTFTSRVEGAVSVVGGPQIDYAAVNGTTVGGGVSLALGNGENAGSVSGIGATIGSFAYTGGTANDTVNLTKQFTVKNGVSVFTGTQGQDSISLPLSSGSTIGGSVVLDTGAGGGDDSVFVGNGNVQGQLSVTTGTGNDEIDVDYVTVGLGLAVNSRAGNDDIEMNSNTVGLNTVIDAGAGDDSVLLSDMQIRSTLFASLGAGTDVLTVNDTTALAAFLCGGTGANTLNVNAATRTGIRTLRYYKFQTVNNT